MFRPYEEIVSLFKKNNIRYEEINHEPVFTSEQAAEVRGISLHAGAKSLLLKAEGEFILAVMPGDMRLDSKKLKEKLGVKNLRFASPTEVEQIMFCRIGSCYPFGNILGIKMLVDPTLGENEIISFNPGIHNKSIKVRWDDYQKVTEPEMVTLTTDF